MLTIKDLGWVEKILETGRQDPEDPAFKILNLLCDELLAIRLEYTEIDMDFDTINILEKVCGY
jgi:hypothetical protein